MQCPPDSGACVFISQNLNFGEGTGTSESCFDAPQKGVYPHEICEVNTAQVHASFNKKIYSFACGHVTATNISISTDAYSTVYTFEAPTKAKKVHISSLALVTLIAKVALNMQLFLMMVACYTMKGDL